jgi:hypothetical protein
VGSEHVSVVQGKTHSPGLRSEQLELEQPLYEIKPQQISQNQFLVVTQIGLAK